MTRVTYIRGDEPHDPFAQATLPGYSLKRGKTMPLPKAAWGQTDANGRGVDHEAGKKVLDDSLGS